MRASRGTLRAVGLRLMVALLVLVGAAAMAVAPADAPAAHAAEAGLETGEDVEPEVGATPVAGGLSAPPGGASTPRVHLTDPTLAVAAPPPVPPPER